MITLPQGGASARAALLREAARLERLAADLNRLANDAAPSDAELLSAPVLNEWRFHSIRIAGLTGLSAGHPRLPDGPIFTTEVWAIDRTAGWARTLSRWYRLRTEAPHGGEAGHE